MISRNRTITLLVSLCMIVGAGCTETVTIPNEKSGNVALPQTQSSAPIEPENTVIVPSTLTPVSVTGTADISTPEPSPEDSAMATEVASWAPTPLSNLGECVLGSTKEWIKIEIKEIGFSMEVPVEWYDYGTILVHEARKEGAYFNATYLRLIQHLAGIEGISVLVWDAEDRTPQEFQNQLGVWLAEQDPPLNDLNYFPFFTSTVSGKPASVTYYPAQHWDPYITSPQILDAYVSIGKYIFNIRYQLRENYDPTEMLTHLLGSMQVEGNETGITQISEVVLCQARLNACLSQCPID